MLRRHVLIAAIFAILPLSHLLFGRGPAFTMYASMLEYRLELLGHDRAGSPKRLWPTLLAAALPSSARPFLTGSESLRRVADVSILRAHLDDVGRVACSRDRSLTDVDVVLVVRSEGGETRTSRSIGCDR